jgi:formylglycine-generating enzyme required for sulfatase activity
MMLLRSRPFVLLVASHLFVVACGGDAGNRESEQTPDATTDGGSFRCNDGTSIPSRSVCDGDQDCVGGEDEANCGANADVVDDIDGDVATDANIDAPPDARIDAADDVLNDGDAVPDTNIDATPDVQVDAADDGDAVPDTNIDATPDVQVDAADDVASDTSTETCPSELLSPGDDFVRISAGSFTMGAPATELGVGIREDRVQVPVTLTRDFWLQATEVTQGEYEALMATNPSCFQSTSGTECSSGSANPNGPVENLSWLDAIAYANARSRAEGVPACYDAVGNVIGGDTVYDCCGYRLATEAEWEYAARAGTTTATYAGDLTGEAFSCDSQPNLDPIAWFCANSGGRTRDVATRSANAWGLYDMLGNVWEWTHDWHATSAAGGTDPWGPATGTNRVIRGGSWTNFASSTRTGYRFRTVPDRRINLLGFRLARTAP